MSKDFRLDFNCPVDIQSMPSCERGKFCTNCDKKVFDYSKMNYADFEKSAVSNYSESSCGIYKGYQLENTFGDWRDNISRVYRKNLRKSATAKRFMLLTPVLVLVLFLTGCARGAYCGMMYRQDMNKPQTKKTYRTPSIKVDTSSKRLFKNDDLPGEQRKSAH